MYIPQHFAENDVQRLHEFMRQHSFATLVTTHDGSPFASHLPLTFAHGIGEHGALLGHIARANPQWQDLAASAEVLAMFQGGHAYVSPAWYEPNAMSVPTWNFTAVHAYGTARILSESELENTLQQLTDEHEKALPQPWKLELTQTMRERMLGAIVGFEITLNRVEGKFKLSQNRNEQDQRNVMEKLAESEHGKAVAHSMRTNLQRKKP
ncbi:MAG: FMN-binding negative transcriptional regulator [Gallionella sp.]